MSRTADKSKEAGEGKADSEGSLASEEEDEAEDDADEEDMDEEDREETPNLYQNSSLGM